MRYHLFQKFFEKVGKIKETSFLLTLFYMGGRGVKKTPLADYRMLILGGPQCSIFHMNVTALSVKNS